MFPRFRGVTKAYTFVLPKALIDAVDAVAQKEGMSRAAAIRHMLEWAIGYYEAGSPPIQAPTER